VDRIGSAADSASISSGADTAQRRFFGSAIQSLPLRTVGLGIAGTAATGLATTTALDTGAASVAKDILEDTDNNREFCQQMRMVLHVILCMSACLHDNAQHSTGKERVVHEPPPVEHGMYVCRQYINAPAG
jgi:hypothetical protein